MRYAVIIAGGSGTRLWPMSTKALPKQLIPFFQGRSLLRIAMERLKSLLPVEQIYVCAGASHKQVMLDNLPDLTEDRFIAEPMGRDTLNAIALATGVLGRKDPDAVVSIFTADHIIEPVDRFCEIVDAGFKLAEANANTLVTFGVTPTRAATGYGYLQLGDSITSHDAHVVSEFKEKPDEITAEQYVAAGPEKYLWNSGMFVWNAATLMQCVERFAPDNAGELKKVIDVWSAPDRDAVLNEVYPTLKKISVDYAIMEPASHDEQVQVGAVPMDCKWLDVGSWPSFADACEKDEAGNVEEGCKVIQLDSKHVTIASDQPNHLVATIGCENLVIIHTKFATLVCPADQAEKIKQLHAEVGEQLGDDYL